MKPKHGLDVKQVDDEPLEAGLPRNFRHEIAFDPNRIKLLTSTQLFQGQEKFLRVPQVFVQWTSGGKKHAQMFHSSAALQLPLNSRIYDFDDSNLIAKWEAGFVEAIEAMQCDQCDLMTRHKAFDEMKNPLRSSASQRRWITMRDEQ